MTLVKTLDFGFSITRYYDLGASSSKNNGGFDRKILVETILDNGQGSKCRYKGRIIVECDGDIKIETAVNPYNTKVKGFDY